MSTTVSMLFPGSVTCSMWKSLFVTLRSRSKRLLTSMNLAGSMLTPGVPSFSSNKGGSPPVPPCITSVTSNHSGSSFILIGWKNSNLSFAAWKRRFVNA